MRRCARFGNGWLPYMYTPERLASSLETIARGTTQIGRSEPITAGVFLFFAVHENRERAHQMAIEYLSTQYNQDFGASRQVRTGRGPRTLH